MLVSNTSTLVLLAKVKCLEAFMDVSPTIEIPIQVKKEALFQPESYDARLIEKLIQEKRIQVTPVGPQKVENLMLDFRLDEGEAAAYLLFNSQKHKAILTDDGELIKLCKLQNVPFICAMAVIVRLYEKKIISKQVALQKLKLLSEIGRYSQKIYDHFIHEVK